MNFDIPALDHSLDSALQGRIDNKTKPLGSLGSLEKIALQVGRIQKTLTPQFCRPHMLIFAADHGAATAGISAYPQDVTWQMVENYLAGSAGANVFARQNGLTLKVIDGGVAHDFGVRENLAVDFIDAKITRNGTRNYLIEPAMSLAQCNAALETGARIARALADEGCNVLGVGEMGIGNTASAALITHALTGAPLDDCVGRGTGLDDEGLARKRQLLGQAARRANLPANADALSVLSEFGGFEIVMMAGALLGAAERGMTLLIDGFIASASLLAASRLAPNIRGYCIFCHRSAEPGHLAQLVDLGGEPLIDIGMRLGEGTGVSVAYPLVCSALVFLNEMASFESAGVSQAVR
jgi:nicotinate-nucleotide--dimethylbenzimidazole phosphoribosyltransferase